MRRPFFFPLFFIPLLFLGGLAVMLLWNAVLPALLHVSVIGYWQALGLLALARILFGGFHGGPFGRHRWARMTPEEREQMRSHWRSHCGWNAEPPAAEGK